MGSTMKTPNYQTLDTYDADLRNETPARREEVTEIQDRETGDLLCYAEPDKAAFIVEACNSHASLVAALEMACPFLHGTANGGRITPLDMQMAKTAFENARTALAQARQDRILS